MVGHHLAQPVDLAIAHLQDAAAIAQHGAGLQLTEGDDLGNVIGAILLLDIADHLAAAGFAEVDIEVRHRDAFRVEEAFEQQAQFQRIEVGNRQRPGHHRTRARTAPRPHRNVIGLGPLDEVGHDQEVAGKAHPVDHVGLEGEPVEIGLPFLGAQFAIGGQPLFKAGAGMLDQHRRLAFLVAGKAWQQRLALGRHEGAALGDHHGIGQRLGQIGKQFGHHRPRLHPGIAGRARALSCVDMGRIGDAQHGIVGRMETRITELGRIGGDQRQVPRIGEVNQRIFGRFLDRVIAPRDLDIEPVREQCFQPRAQLHRRLALASREQPHQRPVARAGQRDQAVSMADEIGHGNMRFQLDRATEMGVADQAAQVVPAGLVLGDQPQPVDRLALVAAHRQEGADERLDARVLAGPGKGHRGVKPVAIGQRDRRESAVLGQFRRRLGIDRPFEHGVARKDAQRDERFIGHAR